MVVFLHEGCTYWSDVMARSCVQPSLENEGSFGSTTAADVLSQQQSEASRFSGSCSADEHGLSNHTFPSLQRCHVCNKFLWGVLRQGNCCRGELLLMYSVRWLLLFRKICKKLSSYSLPGFRRQRHLSMHFSILSQKPIAKLEVEMFQDESWHPVYFGIKRSKVKVSRHKNIASICLCTPVSAGFF